MTVPDHEVATPKRLACYNSVWQKHPTSRLFSLTIASLLLVPFYVLSLALCECCRSLVTSSNVSTKMTWIWMCGVVSVELFAIVSMYVRVHFFNGENQGSARLYIMRMRNLNIVWLTFALRHSCTWMSILESIVIMQFKILCFILLLWPIPRVSKLRACLQVLLDEQKRMAILRMKSSSKLCGAFRTAHCSTIICIYCHIGNVKLSNVRVRPDALDFLGLPFTIKSG